MASIVGLPTIEDQDCPRDCMVFLDRDNRVSGHVGRMTPELARYIDNLNAKAAAAMRLATGENPHA